MPARTAQEARRVDARRTSSPSAPSRWTATSTTGRASIPQTSAADGGREPDGEGLPAVPELGSARAAAAPSPPGWPTTTGSSISPPRCRAWTASSATRRANDDEYFYPEKVTSQGKELTWPAGVRRFSYRKDFDIPSGNGKHNVQIAFNAIPPEQKAYLQYPAGHDAALLRLLRHRLRVRAEQGRRAPTAAARRSSVSSGPA